MIDLRKEELIKLSEAAKLIPSRQSGKKLNASTIWRWGKFGHGGIRLEMLRRPGTVSRGDYVTTAEAVVRFLAAIAELPDEEPKAKPRPVTPSAALDAWTEARLAASGIGGAA